MPIYNVVYIATDDPALLGLPKRINWAWIGYSLLAAIPLDKALEALGTSAPDVVVACLEKRERLLLAAAMETACPAAKALYVQPSLYRSEPEVCVGSLLDNLKQLARQFEDEQIMLLNSAFITRRAEELSERMVHKIDTGDYEGLSHALTAYVEMVVARSKGSNQFVYVKIMELVLLAGYKPMQLKTCFDRLLESDFSKKLQQIIANNSASGIDRYLYRSICDSAAQSASSGQDQGASPIFERSINYIAENYSKKLSLEEVARQAYMSPSYFSNSFHQRMGITFSEYLSILRMSHAKKLLTTTNLRVYEVAEKSGYEDFRHFSKMFKKHTSCSPVEYRKQFAQKEEPR